MDSPSNSKFISYSSLTFLCGRPAASFLAFDDQCTPANPRYPLISEIRELLRRAFYGEDPRNDI